MFALPLVPGEQDLEISFQARPDIVPLGELHGFGVDYDLVGAQGWASLEDAGPGVPLIQRLLRALAWTPLIVALPLAALYLHANLLPYIGSFTVMFVATLATWIVGVASCWFGHVVAARQPRVS